MATVNQITPGTGELRLLCDLPKPTCNIEEAIDAIQQTPAWPISRGTGQVSLTLIAKKHVLKWTSENEALSNEMYDGILGSSPSSFDRCRTPVMGAISPKKAPRALDRILESLDIRNTESARGVPDTILVMEKIEGVSLLKFFFNGYQKLEPGERIELFSRLGHFIIFDLFMGNTDRLVRPGFEEGIYQCDGMLANLDNFMVQTKEGKLSLYAIDNEPDPELQDDPYCTFLGKMFSGNNWEMKLAKEGLSALETALTEERTIPDPLKQDLSEIAQDAMEEGIVGAYGHLRFLSATSIFGRLEERYSKELIEKMTKRIESHFRVLNSPSRLHSTTPNPGDESTSCSSLDDLYEDGMRSPVPFLEK